jgi:hypothetical protein
MKIYLSGNFSIMDDYDREMAFKKEMKEDYNRLCTYFYPKSADITINGEKKNGKKKLIKRFTRSKTRSSQ